jgi:4-diphosphocytidyl-2-C-methyl-D-erythritol kinase
VHRLELRAPAKVNLGLRITGVRDDGYHRIDSLFVPLDLADRLTLELDESRGLAIRLELSGEASADLPEGDENLASQAASAFLERAGLKAEIRLVLDKQIPTGAGLGGGSSDAGAVLRGLAELLPLALTPGELAELALGLGADVPFFLDPRPSRVRGIGEQIEPLAGVPALSLLLAHPGISVATAQVYAAWDACEGALTRNPPRPTMPAAFGPGLEASALRELLENDLEPPAVRLCPSIAGLAEQIASLGALAVGMSGSGATVFGVFEDRAAAEAALARSDFAPGSGVWTRVATTEPSA